MNAKTAFRSLHRGMKKWGNRCLNLIDGPTAVLIYHRVGTLAHDPHLLAVSQDNFRSQLNYLKKNFHVVRFEDDWKNIPKPAVAITFDDGYADNCLNALPILEEVGIPATVFITTGHVGTDREFWWDDLERLILHEGVGRDSFRLEDEQYAGTWQSASMTDRERMYADLHRLMKKVPLETRERWFGQIMAWCGCDAHARASHLPLSVEELKKLAASPWITIGAHTVTHTSLSVLSPERQKEEIVSSAKYLAELIGKPIEVFSYPFGTKADYDSTTVRICREAGFTRVAANFSGLAHSWTDPTLIPRILVRDWPQAQLAQVLSDFM
jgi:peptidoglycan/xylan/chitin deacetylase (PgdA/CDA1 family)